MTEMTYRLKHPTDDNSPVWDYSVDIKIDKCTIYQVVDDDREKCVDTDVEQGRWYWEQDIKRGYVRIK